MTELKFNRHWRHPVEQKQAAGQTRNGSNAPHQTQLEICQMIFETEELTALKAIARNKLYRHERIKVIYNLKRLFRITSYIFMPLAINVRNTQTRIRNVRYFRENINLNIKTLNLFFI